MSVFVVADWHLGENRFEIMGRPFSSQKEMVDTLVRNHNQLVSPDDVVFVLGDVCYQKTPEFLSEVARFNGRKILVRGNHDRVFDDEKLSEYFELIVPEGDGIFLDLPFKEETNCPGSYNMKLFMTHYPTQGEKDCFNLVGHIHGAWKYQLNMLNVGVDVHNYRPVNIESLLFHFKAIRDYYDDDVWVGYNEINVFFQNKRGKPGSYYTS